MGVKIAVFVYILAIAMDLVAGVLGIEAEIAKNKCGKERPSSEAFKLGLTAAILLALAHIASNMLSGYICVCSMNELERSFANRRLWFASLIFSWITMAIGLPTLIMGVLENSRIARESCNIALNNHSLFFGGILCLLHGFICISLFVSATLTFGSSNEINSSTGHHGADRDP